MTESTSHISGNEITITRLIHAPREQVWNMWTEVQHLVQWWGQPKGAKMPEFKMDFRVGGTFLYKIELPDGKVIWGKKIYKEIDEPNRLVFDDFFSDEDGNVIITEETPHMVITVVFEADGDATKLIITHAGITGSTHTVDQYKEGWAQVLDRLDELVTTIR